MLSFLLPQAGAGEMSPARSRGGRAGEETARRGQEGENQAQSHSFFFVVLFFFLFLFCS